MSKELAEVIDNPRNKLIALIENIINNFTVFTEQRACTSHGCKLRAEPAPASQWRAKGPEKPIYLEPSFYLLLVLSYSYEGKEMEVIVVDMSDHPQSRARSSGDCLT